ncbi:MAG: bifunctional riboflavin kinase/FAD synthetase [Verrucomicrobiae bacterium]|nr:bifunctional riboflavin kinase/FAD synthetase [Verrucomicrobiae bacterium]
MKTLHAISELVSLPKPLCLAIGVFDGVHRGHQALIAAVKKEALTRQALDVIVTFEPHPLKILRPEAPPQLLTSTRHKLYILESFKVSATLVIPFNLAFSQTLPEDFIQQLVDASPSLKLIGIGHRWEFGYQRMGNAKLLEKLGQRYHFDVLELSPVIEDNETISSTRIRQAVRDGNLHQAALLLGRPFSLFGKVVKGQGLGEQLQFPTANLDLEGEKLPPFGVYAARCQVQNQTYQAAVNIGIRPTFNSNTPTVEAHLLNFTGDLYGKDIEIFLLKKIRDEKKFSGVEDLKQQIKKDIEQIKKT